MINTVKQPPLAINKVLLVQAGKINAMIAVIAQPLGLMYLAAVLREKANCEVKILDLRVTNEELNVVLKEFQPDLVGLSGVTQDEDVIFAAARTIKKYKQNLPVMLGGPHATAYYEDVLMNNDIDVVVYGEGELTVLELVEALRSGRDLCTVKGLALRDGTAVRLTMPREPIIDLDSMLWPAWDLIDNKLYSYNPKILHLRARADYMILFSSRGCPYRCSYCHNIFGKQFRARSPENVLREVSLLYHQYGVREIEIWDDIFNLDYQRASKILDLIAASGMQLKLSFPNGVRADLLDEKILRKLKAAGTVHLAVAVETASPRLQKCIHKNLNLKKVKENIALASRLGMMTRGFFMLGFPGETKEEMQLTFDYAISSKLHLAIFFVLNPFKGSEIYEQVQCLKTNQKIDYSKLDYNRSSGNLSYVSTAEVDRLIGQAYFRFFFAGPRLLRLFWVYPNKWFFFRNFFRYAFALVKRMRLFKKVYG